MELSQWFDYQLRSTLDGFIWAVNQLPKECWQTRTLMVTNTLMIEDD